MDKIYSETEEIANGITHGVGTVLSIVGLIILILYALEYGDIWHIVSYSIFGSSLVILYLASTLYHSLPNSSVKRIFKIIDHSAIYLLIAGSYTPFLMISLRGTWGWSLFAIIWMLAIIGIILKSIFIGRFKKSSLVLYLLMGWLSIIAFHELIKNLPHESLVLLVLGGIAYTTGVIFYVWKRLLFNHAIWHMFVMAGSTLHFFSVLFILKPY